MCQPEPILEKSDITCPGLPLQHGIRMHWWGRCNRSRPICFFKAFDVVIHKLIVSKLSCFRIHGSMSLYCNGSSTSSQGWEYRPNKPGIQPRGIGGGLTSHRTTRVCIQGHLSQSQDVVSGVPQGYALGPLLFYLHKQCGLCPQVPVHNLCTWP